MDAFGIHANLFNSELYSDLKIICNDRNIHAHRAILHSSSDVFASLIQESSTNKIDLMEVNGAIIFELIRYIYTGFVENLDEIALELLDVANRYGIRDLKQKCINSISRYLSIKNVLRVSVVADRLNETILFQNCVKFIQL